MNWSSWSNKNTDTSAGKSCNQWSLFAMAFSRVDLPTPLAPKSKVLLPSLILRLASRCA